MSKRQTRGRKRHRVSLDNSENDSNSNNKNKKQKTNNAVNNNNNKRLQLIALSEYFCCVCKDLSCGKIFQCPNGCVICEGCYPKINPCHCPLCRTVMSKHKPIRCRMAEKTLSLRLVTCRFDGCNKEILFGKLKYHESNDCQFKPIHCKFNVLGCKWTGLRQNQLEHEKKCKINQDNVLKIVNKYIEKVECYKKFCKQCTNTHCDSVWISSNDIFEIAGDDFYYEGYEYKMKIKSELKHLRRNQEIYQVSLKLVFAEDTDQLDDGETIDIDLGVIIEPHGVNENSEPINLMKQIQIIVNRNRTESEWIKFDQEFTQNQYRSLFRGGFDMKIFCFSEDI